MASRGVREPGNDHLFLGIAPGGYQAMLPAFICSGDVKPLKACVAFGAPDQESLAPRVSRAAGARAVTKKS
jgi:putative restriction endonuclease